MCKPIDFQLLQLIVDKGAIYYRKTKEELGAEARDALLRCKSRHLVVSLHQKGGYYKYDITPLGRSVLEEKDRQETEGYTPRFRKYQRTR